MKLDLFFRGMQNRETSASAWLATLLRDDEGFRRAFLSRIPVDPPLDSHAGWTFGVETLLHGGACDVTFENADTIVFLENKLSASAQTEGQLLRYYLGVLEDPKRATKRAIGVYLAPSARMGSGEQQRLMRDPAFQDRAGGTGDAAVCLGWRPDVQDAVEEAAEPGDWFARTGLAAILGHIDRIRTGRTFDQQRHDLYLLMKRVARRVMGAGGSDGWGSGVRLDRWPSVGQEVLYTPGQAVSMFLTLRYEEAPDEPHGIDVFDGDLIHLHASVSFNPSVKHGLHDAALMVRWASLTQEHAAEVPGIGLVPLHTDIGFEKGVDFHGPADDLEDLLVAWGVAVLSFLRQFQPPTA